MPLLDLDKTTLKISDVKWIVAVAIAMAGAGWRFESRMSDVEENTTASINALREEIIYNYTLELLKVNNRIDLLEAKKFVQRYNFRRDTSRAKYVFIKPYSDDANKDNHKREKYPQFCMLPPRTLEYELRPKLPNIKKLIS